MQEFVMAAYQILELEGWGWQVNIELVPLLEVGLSRLPNYKSLEVDVN